MNKTNNLLIPITRFTYKSLKNKNYKNNKNNKNINLSKSIAVVEKSDNYFLKYLKKIYNQK